MIETARSTKNRLFFDAGDDAQTVIRVDNLIADFKCHGSPCWKRSTVGRISCRQSTQYSSLYKPIQRERPEKWAFFDPFPLRRGVHAGPESSRSPALK